MHACLSEYVYVDVRMQMYMYMDAQVHLPMYA